MTTNNRNAPMIGDEDDQMRRSSRSTNPVSSSGKNRWNSFDLDRSPSNARPSGEERPSFKARLSRRLSSHPNSLGPWSFKEVRKLGEGSFGKVALATVLQDAPLPQMRGKQVALKRMRERLRYNQSIRKKVYIEQEAHALVSGHPNIATLYGSFETKRSYYLVVEAIDGGSVEDVLDIFKKRAKRQIEKSMFDPSVKKPNRAGMPEIIVVTIVRQVAQALAFMHDAGVAHRDLKPDNVMLAKKLANTKCPTDVSARVVDFGLAGLFNEDVDGDDAPVKTSDCGTEFFMAPEVMKAQKYDCRKADVYSLGVMLYEMITGSTPFPCGDDEDLAKVKMQGPDFIDVEWKDVTEGLKVIANGMMQADPENRPSATETAHLLVGIERKLKQKLNK